MSPLRDTNVPSHLRASAMALAIAGILSIPAQATAASDSSWIHFRADPAVRIFADMAEPRSPPLPVARIAATWPVTNCADAGAGSLRDAVDNAANGDTIDLTALTCATITLQTGAIPIRLDDLTLIGPGRNALAIDGNDSDRVFFHPGQGQLLIQAMTIQHGADRATGFDVAGGGCIASAGYLTLDDTTVRNCYAGGEGAYGGAIYAYSLTMANSTLSGNVGYGVHEDAGTAAFGGAAFVYTMQLVDSTVTGNRADHRVNPGRTSYDIGGGIITVRGGGIENSTIDSNVSQGRGGGIAAFNPITISNSTLSGNIAQTEIGGALFVRAPATLEANNNTITANRAQTGGGVWLPNAGSNLQSNIVFGNSTGAGLFADVQGRSTFAIDGSHNLIGASDPAVTLPADTLHANPLLGPLANNGGPTRTHALLAGSPAVDAGTVPSNVKFDQRGAPFTRTYGAATDIGAYEQQPPPPPARIVATPVPTLSPWMLSVLAALLGLLSLRARGCRGMGLDRFPR